MKNTIKNNKIIKLLFIGFLMGIIIVILRFSIESLRNKKESKEDDLLVKTLNLKEGTYDLFYSKIIELEQNEVEKLLYFPVKFKDDEMKVGYISVRKEAENCYISLKIQSNELIKFSDLNFSELEINFSNCLFEKKDDNTPYAYYDFFDEYFSYSISPYTFLKSTSADFIEENKGNYYLSIYPRQAFYDKCKKEKRKTDDISILLSFTQ